MVFYVNSPGVSMFGYELQQVIGVLIGSKATSWLTAPRR